MRCRVTKVANEAAEILRDARLVAIPTETVYGLAGNAFNPSAVAKIFSAKDRPEFDPLIVHVASTDQIPLVASEFPDLARRLADRFWPGPLTIVLPKTDRVPDLVTSGLPTVAVRIPEHPLTQRLLELTGFPLAAPSANLFGRLSPTSVEHVLEQLGDRIELVLDGGPCRVGVESTIVQIVGEEAILLRPGGVPVEAITEMAGPVRLADLSQSSQPTAPGQLPSHYAPRTPLRLVDAIPETAPRAGLGALVSGPRILRGYEQIEVLSPYGDLTEAAANFFPALHRLDRAGLHGILAEPFPQAGLGRALNDRLHRAAAGGP